MLVGGVTSTVNTRLAGRALDVAGLIDGADVEDVPAVGERARSCCGEPTGANGVPRSRHWSVRTSASAEENSKVTAAVVTLPDGPESIVAVGAVVSARAAVDVKVREDGAVSALPASSTARTLSVWAPSASPVSCVGELQSS